MAITNIRHSFTLEHPETGEVFEFIMDAWEDYHPGQHTLKNGDPGDPPMSETGFDDWWEVISGEKPVWVTDKMLYDELQKIDFTH